MKSFSLKQQGNRRRRAGKGSLRLPTLLTALLTLFLSIGVSKVAVCQKSGTYRPSSPTFSPYLNLFRRDPGQLLPSYQQFVRPEIELRRFARQQTEDVRTLSRELQRVEQAQTVPSGIGGGFRNSIPYFRNSTQYFQTHRFRP